MSIQLIGHDIYQLIFLCDESRCMLINKLFVTLSYVYKCKYVSVD